MFALCFVKLVVMRFALLSVQDITELNVSRSARRGKQVLGEKVWTNAWRATTRPPGLAKTLLALRGDEQAWGEFASTLRNYVLAPSKEAHSYSSTGKGPKNWSSALSSAVRRMSGSVNAILRRERYSKQSQLTLKNCVTQPA